MTAHLASRTPSRTLAEVLAAIAAVPDLSPQRRQNLASAVRTVARLLDRAPEAIPADPPLLAHRLDEVAPRAHGLSRGRWANVRSLLRASLALTRPMLPGRQVQPLSPGWRMLYDRLPCTARQMRLSRLLRYLSIQGIAPETVTAEHMADFTRALRQETLLRDPEATWREIVWAWNRTRQETPGWPQLALSFAPRRKTYTLPWSAFPASLKADADRYLDRLAGRDLTEDLPFRPVRPETRHLRERQFRTFASALVHRGRDPATLCTLADLVAPEAFKDGLRFFLDRRGGASSITIEHLASFLKSIAKHWVRTDTATLETMNAIIRRLSVPRRGMTAKNRDRLRPLDDPEIRHALVNLPPRLMREAASNRLPPPRAALKAQIAVALEILLMAPIRLRNLVNLDLDRHLVRPTRARGPLHIVIEGHEVKNGSDLDYPLPEESAALIGQYLERHHPILAPSGNRALFPGRHGAPKSMQTLRGQIIRAVFRDIGIKVNPHLFRHIGAKLHLDEHPGEHAVVTRALGNRSIDVTANHYAGFETAAAVRHFDRTILELRHRRPKP